MERVKIFVDGVLRIIKVLSKTYSNERWTIEGVDIVSNEYVRFTETDELKIWKWERL